MECKNCEHYNICVVCNYIHDKCGYYEPIRPHGEWIYEYDDFYHCSICGDVICTQWDELSLKKYFPFCHCGAGMRKEGDAKWK